VQPRSAGPLATIGLACALLLPSVAAAQQAPAPQQQPPVLEPPPAAPDQGPPQQQPPIVEPPAAAPGQPPAGAPADMPPPRITRRPTPRDPLGSWKLVGNVGMQLSVPDGPDRFGLSGEPGNPQEFDPAFGFDLMVAGLAPGHFLGVGLRLALTFGPLNTSAWEKRLDDELSASSLLHFGPAFLVRLPQLGPVRPWAAVEGLAVLLGTATSESECFDDDCVDSRSIDLLNVQYTGFAVAFAVGGRVALAAGGAEIPGKTYPYVFFEGRYARNFWRSLEVQIGSDVIETPRNDVDTLTLDHFTFTLGFGVGI